MSPKAIAVVGLSALALAANGCGGGSESEAEKFRASFEKEFSTAPWYRHVTGIKVKENGLEVRTDLGPESAWHGEGSGETSLAICREAWGVAVETGAIDRSEGVYVKGRGGGGLISCA